MDRHDEDELDALLAALPPHELPPGLHERILAATVWSPPSAPVVRPWELWLVGLVVALAVWSAGALVSDAQLAERAAAALAQAARSGALLTTLAWFAVGAAAAFWSSLLAIPAPQRLPLR